MEFKDYDRLREQFKQETDELAQAKGREYTDGADRLFNFKIIAEFLRIPPEMVCLVYMVKALLSLTSTTKRLAKGEKIADIGGDLTESVKSRCQDIDNYNMFYWALINERMEEERREKDQPAKAPE